MIKKNNEKRTEIKINNEFISLNYLNYFYCNFLNKNNCVLEKNIQIYIPEKKIRLILLTI